MISVGTELLLGHLVNSNAAEIGGMLTGSGIDCHHHTTVGDNEARIAEAIATALSRAEAVIVTGGLGPTQDDVTREAICRVTSQQLIRDAALEEALRDRFERMHRPMAPSNLRQADRPADAIPIETVIGTAPGLIVQHADGVIYAIPGVPAEMREMMARAVLPDLRRRMGTSGATVSRVIRVAGVAESAVADALSALWGSLEGGRVTMAYLAGGGEVRVRLTAKAASADAAASALEPVERAVRDTLGPAVVGVDDETLEVAVGALLRSRGLSVALAESVTGGLAAARLTRVPGASDYVRGGVVAYTLSSKIDLLGVPGDLIERAGVVSQDVARAMAAGVRSRFAADVGLAYTGAAGPEPHGEAPPGTVVLAADGPLGTVARTVRLPGERETVRTLAAAAGLNLLRLYLLEGLE